MQLQSVLQFIRHLFSLTKVFTPCSNKPTAVNQTMVAKLYRTPAVASPAEKKGAMGMSVRSVLRSYCFDLGMHKPAFQVDVDLKHCTIHYSKTALNCTYVAVELNMQSSRGVYQSDQRTYE